MQFPSLYISNDKNIFCEINTFMSLIDKKKIKPIYFSLNPQSEDKLLLEVGK